MIVLSGLLAQSVTLAGTVKDPYKYFFNETWGDFSEELENAKQQQKKGILIFFEMDECPFCHYMKHNVLNQPEVQAFYREHFLNFSVDIEGDIEITNMQGKQTKPLSSIFCWLFKARDDPVLENNLRKRQKFAGCWTRLQCAVLRYLVDPHFYLGE